MGGCSLKLASYCHGDGGSIVENNQGSYMHPAKSPTGVVIFPDMVEVPEKG